MARYLKTSEYVEEVNVIMRDFDVKVEQGTDDDIVVNFDLEQTNERGDR